MWQGIRSAKKFALILARFAPKTAWKRRRSSISLRKANGKCASTRISARSTASKAIPDRSAEGIYDRMASVGAHEIVVETPDHTRTLAQMTDEEIERVLDAWARRIADLKRDARFKYVTVFKNTGTQAGEEWPHAHSQITATTFVPRRILYELRSAREWFRERERCVFCDILRQEIRQAKRIVDSAGDYYAFCPYASRVPYEIWIIPRTHNHQFESGYPGRKSPPSGQPSRPHAPPPCSRSHPAIIWSCTLRPTRCKPKAN